MSPNAFQMLTTVAWSGHSVSICRVNVRLISRVGGCSKTNSCSSWPSWKQKGKAEPQIRFWNSDQYINYSPGPNAANQMLWFAAPFSLGQEDPLAWERVESWKSHWEYAESIKNSWNPDPGPQIVSFQACLGWKRAPIPRLKMECSRGA